MLKRGQRRQELGHYEIELKVNNVLRGEAAEEQLYDLSAYVLDEQKILDSQEYMLINLTVNIPSAHLDDDALLIIDSMDFGVINSKTGKEYGYENLLYLRPHDLCSIAPGGTATGWIGVIIDKPDDSPTMYYQSLNNKMLYFKLDKAYDVPDGFASYNPSPVFLENPIRDLNQKKGHWNNPYEMGETVDLNYMPMRDEKLGSPFSGNICVQEAYRGELAEKFLHPSYYYLSESDKELIVLKIAVNVKEVDGNNAPQFDADSYTILTGQGGEVVAWTLYGDTLKTEEIQQVYPGGKAEGYVAFQVPKGIERFVLTYGNAFTGIVDNAWISLDFSDHIPEDVAGELEKSGRISYGIIPKICK